MLALISSSSSDMTPTDQDERFDKLKEEDARFLTNNNFFPEMAWRKVTEKLKNKADIENCSNASPFLADLLREKRERKVVLPTVFVILAKRYWDKKTKNESYEETNFESILWERPPQSEEPHRMTGLWKCRLVCKKWNKAIQEIHPNEDAAHYRMMGPFCAAENAYLGEKWGTERFNSESQVVKFLGHFEATHYDCGGGVSKQCPFLGRAFEVGYDWVSVETNQAFLNRLVGMFEKFGDQVLFFRILLAAL